MYLTLNLVKYGRLPCLGMTSETDAFWKTISGKDDYFMTHDTGVNSEQIVNANMPIQDQHHVPYSILFKNLVFEAARNGDLTRLKEFLEHKPKEDVLRLVSAKTKGATRWGTTLIQPP